MKGTKLLALALTVLGGFSGPSAWAFTNSSQSAVFQATVATVCTATLQQALTFGTLTVTAGNIVQKDFTGTLLVTCTNGGTYNTIPDSGLQPNGTQRRMLSTTTPGYFINYNLYLDPGHSVPFPSGGAAGIASGGADQVPLYGRVPGQAFTRVGNFSDTITISIVF